MKCCGQECSTAYCPKCGNIAPSCGLLAHVRSQAERCETTAVYWEQLAAEGASIDSYTDARRVKRASRSRKVANRWASWLAELERLMALDQDPKPVKE